MARLWLALEEVCCAKTKTTPAGRVLHTTTRKPVMAGPANDAAVARYVCALGNELRSTTTDKSTAQAVAGMKIAPATDGTAWASARKVSGAPRVKPSPFIAAVHGLTMWTTTAATVKKT